MAELVRAGDSISVALGRTLSEYCEEENEHMKKAVHKAAISCRRELKQTSPGSGKYAGGWAVRVKMHKRTIDATVYNREYPRFTHLLENPHEIKNQYGEYGTTSIGRGRKPHIQKAAENAEEFLINELVGGH